MTKIVSQPVRHWLRAEGLAAFVVAVVIYSIGDASWILFAVLFLAPDLSFAGYLAGPRRGAIVYNLAHSYVGPLLLTAALLLLNQPLVLALIWVAHIGLDRALGYGLKLPTGFKDTHLGTIGQR